MVLCWGVLMGVISICTDSCYVRCANGVMSGCRCVLCGAEQMGVLLRCTNLHYDEVY